MAEQQRLGLNEGGREGVDGIQFRNLLELEACLTGYLDWVCSILSSSLVIEPLCG